MKSAYAALAAAIACEIVGTAFLQKSEQFTRVLPTLAVVVFYAGAFYLLSHSLRSIPVGIAYATWSGIGIVLTATVGAVVFKQALDVPALVGIAMIVGGVVVMQGLSTTTGH